MWSVSMGVLAPFGVAQDILRSCMERPGDALKGSPVVCLLMRPNLTSQCGFGIEIKIKSRTSDYRSPPGVNSSLPLSDHVQIGPLALLPGLTKANGRAKAAVQ
jgi:hypothetical protein